MVDGGESRKLEGGSKVNRDGGPHTKSCKGCLFYSSTLKSKLRDPICFGLTRSFPQVSLKHIEGSEMEIPNTEDDGKGFRYTCIGYSMYKDGKNLQTELPMCAGIEILAYIKEDISNHPPTTAQKNTEGIIGHNQHSPPKNSSNSVGNAFLTRFSRNAEVVGRGVERNAWRMGNYIKRRIQSIFDPPK